MKELVRSMLSTAQYHNQLIFPKDDLLCSDRIFFSLYKSLSNKFFNHNFTIILISKKPKKIIYFVFHSNSETKITKHFFFSNDPFILKVHQKKLDGVNVI